MVVQPPRKLRKWLRQVLGKWSSPAAGTCSMQGSCILKDLALAAPLTARDVTVFDSESIVQQYERLVMQKSIFI